MLTAFQHKIVDHLHDGEWRTIDDISFAIESSNMSVGKSIKALEKKGEIEVWHHRLSDEFTELKVCLKIKN